MGPSQAEGRSPCSQCRRGDQRKHLPLVDVEAVGLRQRREGDVHGLSLLAVGVAQVGRHRDPHVRGVLDTEVVATTEGWAVAAGAVDRVPGILSQRVLRGRLHARPGEPEEEGALTRSVLPLAGPGSRARVATEEETAGTPGHCQGVRVAVAVGVEGRGREAVAGGPVQQPGVLELTRARQQPGLQRGKVLVGKQRGVQDCNWDVLSHAQVVQQAVKGADAVLVNWRRADVQGLAAEPLQPQELQDRSEERRAKVEEYAAVHDVLILHGPAGPKL
mmetsp:Transcript_11/g.45  ORF Transcript_11/g.45 Transcript_11/m.45 type:complete len:275 (+) Transcript_11:60-884(+)